MQAAACCCRCHACRLRVAKVLRWCFGQYLPPWPRNVLCLDGLLCAARRWCTPKFTGMAAATPPPGYEDASSRPMPAGGTRAAQPRAGLTRAAHTAPQRTECVSCMPARDSYRKTRREKCSSGQIVLVHLCCKWTHLPLTFIDYIITVPRIAAFVCGASARTPLQVPQALCSTALHSVLWMWQAVRRCVEHTLALRREC